MATRCGPAWVRLATLLSDIGSDLRQSQSPCRAHRAAGHEIRKLHDLKIVFTTAALVAAGCLLFAVVSISSHATVMDLALLLVAAAGLPVMGCVYWLTLSRQRQVGSNTERDEPVNKAAKPNAENSHVALRTGVMAAGDSESDSHRDLVQRRRQRLESLGTLASGIVHDLNNLLTPILMSSRMLQRSDPNINRKALLETISHSASRGADLIAQLLTFARGGDGQAVPVDLNKVIPDVIAILRHTLSDSIDLRVHVQDGLPKVLADETELSQVLMNLAINARDAMPDGGVLQICTEHKTLSSETTYSYVTLPPGQYVCLKVTDSGRGITDEVRERMFDPFFTTKPRGQGTGLGLSTSLGIIRSCSGAVDVQSVPSQETAITVILPAASTTDRLPESNPAQKSNPAKNMYKPASENG